MNILLLLLSGLIRLVIIIYYLQNALLKSRQISVSLYEWLNSRENFRATAMAVFIVIAV